MTINMTSPQLMTDEGSLVSEVKALILSDSEKLIILDLFGSQEDFLAWQKETLSSEIERRAAQRASTEANAIIAQKIAEYRQQVPTLYPEGGSDV